MKSVPPQDSRQFFNLDNIRLHLARPDALLPLSLLGLITGILAAAVIVLFRWLVEGSQDLLLPGNGAENYEALQDWQAFLLPLAGALALALLFRFFAQGQQVLGIANLLERMHYHQGRLTVRGFLLQFFGAAFAIISGHSVGREAPHVYLGAASGSLMGQYLSLPNNSIRTFVACGSAAGIAASFNTPLAGVVFALEVIMMEYSVASFIPVILAAVSATAVANNLLGHESFFTVPATAPASLGDLGLVIVLGIAAGTVSAAFVHLLQTTASLTRAIPIWWRLMLAGLLMGLIGMLIPQVMGIGYDTVNLALNGQLALGLVSLLIFAKLVATALVIGLGVPGGMIGPTLFIGSMLGASMALLLQLVPLQLNPDTALFATLGMGAMMAASLQAPLAALTAMLELTDNPAIILPGMLAVVVSGLTAKVVFGKDSLFLSMLRAAGQDYDANPILKSLRRIGIASSMSTSYLRLDRVIEHSRARNIISSAPDFLLVNGTEGPVVLMPSIELAKYIETNPHQQDQPIDLLAIPAQRWQVSSIDLASSLQEAYELLDSGATEALYVERSLRQGQRIYGVVTRAMVEKAYKY